MITTFNQYIVAQMRNPHQKFEAVYDRQGKLEGLQAVGKFRQFAYATFNKEGSDRISRQLAVAVKQLRDEANVANGKISGWGKIGHERLTFPVRTQDQENHFHDVDMRERIKKLTHDRSSLSDAQIERLHKIECSILLVERLNAGASAEDTASLVSNGSAMNDAITSGNTDHLFRMRTQAERAASKDEIGKNETQSKKRFDKANHLVVNARLELVNQPRLKTAALAETYGTVGAREHAANKAVGAVNYGQVHSAVFAKPEEVTYATVKTPSPIPSPIRKPVDTPAAEPAPVVDLIPEEDEFEDVAPAGRALTQKEINARIEKEVARLYKTGELKRTPPASPTVTPAFVKDDNAVYSAVIKPASPVLPERTPASHILKPAVAPKPAAKPDVAPPLPPKPSAAERAQTYDKGDAVEFATVPSRGAARRAEALAKLAGN